MSDPDSTQASPSTPPDHDSDSDVERPPYLRPGSTHCRHCGVTSAHTYRPNEDYPSVDLGFWVIIAGYLAFLWLFITGGLVLTFNFLSQSTAAILAAGLTIALAVILAQY
jgi:hypothetical protein